MKLYISTDTNTFITNPLFPAPISSVSFKRGDSATVELVFVTNNAEVTATAGRQIQFGIKESGKYDGSYLVSQTSYTLSGTSYVLKPSFNTVAINTLLGSGDANTTNDIASVSCMLEVTWSVDSGANWFSTNTIEAVINNDVNKGSEGTPLSNPTPEAWLATQLATAQLPSPQSRTEPPVSYWPDAVEVTSSSLVITNEYLISNSAGGWSSDGSLTPAVSGPWYSLVHNASEWEVASFYDGSYVSSITSDPCPASVSPGYIGGWVDSYVTESPNTYTSGLFNQTAIVNDSNDYSSVWICVRETPVRWLQTA